MKQTGQAFSPLSSRFTAYWTLLLVGLVGLALGATWYLLDQRVTSMQEQLSLDVENIHNQHEFQHLQEAAYYLNARLFDPLMNQDLSRLTQELRSTKRWMDAKEFLLTDAQGNLITDGSEENARLGARVIIPDQARDASYAIQEMGDGLQLAFAIGNVYTPTGFALINVSRDAAVALSKATDRVVQQHWRKTSSYLNRLTLGAISLALLASLLIGYRLSRTLSAPLRAMTDAADRFAAGDLRFRLSDIPANELGSLAEALNRMAGNIETAHEDLTTFSLAIEQSPVSVMILDQTTRVQFVNRAFVRTTGKPSEEVLGLPYGVVFPTQSRHDNPRLWEELLDGRPWHGDLRERRRDGEEYWAQAHLAPVRNHAGEVHHFVVIKQDISDRKAYEHRILQQAHFDSLTGLPNRLLSLDRLGRMIADSRRSSELAAVLFVDLDDFKKINDAMGHDCGDAVLVEAAERFAGTVRTGDTVGRLGGDEFIVLLGGLHSPTHARIVAENLLAEVRKPFHIQSQQLLLGASIGIAVVPTDGVEEGEVLRNADSAMYHAKTLGRNQYCFYAECMNQDVRRRISIEEQLQGALARGEFGVVYQPKFDVLSSRLMGVEALLRWSNEVFGDVSPAEFIPLIEQSGLILPAGRLLLHEALRTISSLRRQLPEDFSLSVNLSARQLRDPEFIDFLERELLEHKLDGSMLELEINEAVLLQEQLHPEAHLSRLRKLNVRLSMDAFGSGYSSLDLLRRYPFHRIKIDRQSVQSMATSTSDRKLVEATILMAHGMQREVIAVGVEDADQLQVLRDIDCDQAQGYLLGKPEQAAELAKRLAPPQPDAAQEDSSFYIPGQPSNKH